MWTNLNKSSTCKVFKRPEHHREVCYVKQLGPKHRAKEEEVVKEEVGRAKLRSSLNAFSFRLRLAEQQKN